MYGPNDILGACGGDSTKNGCFSVIILFVSITSIVGAGVYFALC